MSGEKRKKLVLSDGSEYRGTGFGADKSTVCELVFNTSPVGYQEILSDPSYTDQTVVMAYPLIGNYGVNPDDLEADWMSDIRSQSPGSRIGGLVVRDYNDRPSNFRSKRTLSSLMEEYDIPGISDVDTRELVRRIRDEGSRIACITDADMPSEEAVRMIKEYPIPHDAVSRVSRKKIQSYKAAEQLFHVACVDLGMKENIIRSFIGNGCSLTVFPWDAPADEIRGCRPDGVFFSNGPGDPKDVKCAIDLVRDIWGEYPMFGICLGHQIIALALGAKTYKLKFGHRGGNHPVRNVMTGRIEMTSQNHSYAVDGSSLDKTGLYVTHINLLDKTVEGLRSKTEPCFSVQYHPESAPGPSDGSYLFGQFIDMMRQRKG